MRLTVFAKIGLFLLLGGVIAGDVAASTAARPFMEGLRRYAEGDYAGAARSFEAAAETGVRNGKLYYNLGNAHLKNGDVGRAVLWYLRALKKIPDDPDLAFNLDYARSLLTDESGDAGGTLANVLLFWRRMLSRSDIQKAAIGFNLLFWLVLAASRRLKKKAMGPVAVMLLAAAAIFTLTAFYGYYEDHYVKNAVILPDSVSVRSGLSDSATELFVLHAGSLVRVDKESGGFVRIHFSTGKIGWLPREAIGII